MPAKKRLRRAWPLAQPRRPASTWRVPLFVGYGTHAAAVVAHDYPRLEARWPRKTNFTFWAYVGREHHFFGFKDSRVNYDDFYWDRVGLLMAAGE